MKAAYNSINDTFAAEIIALFDGGEATKDIAAVYGVHNSTVEAIAQGRTYQHVDPARSARLNKIAPTRPNKGARLVSDEIALDIMTSPLTVKELAAMYGIAVPTANNIRANRYYRDVSIAVNTGTDAIFA